MFAAADYDQLITTALPWPCQHGKEDAVLLDAFGGFLHGRILPHLKGVIREWVQLGERKLTGNLPMGVRLWGMTQALGPVLSALSFQALCSSRRPLILGAIIATSKLAACPALNRPSPCKGHQIILSHHMHCRPQTGKAHSFRLLFSFKCLLSSICFPSESLMLKLSLFPR